MHTTTHDTWRWTSWAESLNRVLEVVYDPTTRIPVPWLLPGDVALALQGVSVEPQPQTIEFRTASPVATSYFALLMRHFEPALNRPIVLYGRSSGMSRGGRQSKVRGPALGENHPSDSLGSNLAASSNGAASSGLVAPESWRSNRRQRVIARQEGGSTVWLGRWAVGTTIVQARYLRTVYPDPVALAFQPHTYLPTRHSPVAPLTLTSFGPAPIRRAPFGSLEVAVVPLEYLVVEAALRTEHLVGDVHQSGERSPFTRKTHCIIQAMRSHGHNPADLEAALSILPAERAARLLRLLEFRMVKG